MKTILITGGAGFIGSHLCDYLVDRGDQVICVDNLLTGSQKNISHLLAKQNFEFINHDVSKPIKKRFKDIDEVYHLASPADPNYHSLLSYIAHPFETMLVNTVGTWNMCEMAIKYGAKLSFSSTSEVYGDPEVSPQVETYRGNVSTTGPRSVYDEAKRFGETIVSSFIREKKLDGRITRIFNTYGPRMNINEGRAVVNFIKQAVQGKPMTIYGDGFQTRSFCFISDQIKGQIAAMDTKGTTGEIYNIGNPVEKSILDFAKKIKEVGNSKSEIIFSDPLPVDDPLQRKPDITKAKECLQWEPTVNLSTGLASTIDYFRQELK